MRRRLLRWLHRHHGYLLTKVYLFVFVTLTAAMAFAALAGVRRHFGVVRVFGPSMTPTYRPGDRVLVRRIGRSALRRGQVVVFQNRRPGGGWSAEPLPELRQTRWMVKRIVAVPGDLVPDEVLSQVGASPGAVVPPGRLVVRGDGIDSEDSRHWGYLPVDRVRGICVRRLSLPAPPEEVPVPVSPPEDGTLPTVGRSSAI